MANKLQPIPVDLDRLEGEISDMAKMRRTTPLPAPATPMPPLPGYVDHIEGVNNVGKLTAEVIVRDYEETARRINEIGEHLGKVARRCEEFMVEIHQMITTLDTVGNRYRERGAEIFRQLEASALVTEEIRKVANEMVGKIGASLEDSKSN